MAYSPTLVREAKPGELSHEIVCSNGAINTMFQYLVLISLYDPRQGWVNQQANELQPGASDCGNDF